MNQFDPASVGTGGGGKKDDAGKTMWHLLIPKFIEPIIRVLMYGCLKYESQSWQRVPNGKERYWSAMWRHLSAMVDSNGEIDLDCLDEESKMPHLWHAFCNMYFLQYFNRG